MVNITSLTQDWNKSKKMKKASKIKNPWAWGPFVLTSLWEKS